MTNIRFTSFATLERLKSKNKSICNGGFMWSETKNDVGYFIITPTFRRISKHEKKHRRHTPNSVRWDENEARRNAPRNWPWFRSNAAGTTKTIEYYTAYEQLVINNATKLLLIECARNVKDSQAQRKHEYHRIYDGRETKRWHHNTLQCGVFICSYVCISSAMFAQYLLMRAVLISCMPSDWDDGDRNETHGLCGRTRVLISSDVNMQHGH